MGLGVNLSDPVEQRIVSLGGTRKLKIGLDKQAKDSIAEALRQGRELGEGADDLARRIVDMVGKGPWATAETRAMVVARTETKYAQNASSLEAYKSSDTVSSVRVFDAQLGPTDAECEELNGQEVSFEEADALAESEHPNGTRSFAPVVKSARAAGGNGHGHAPVINLAVHSDGKIHLLKRNIKIVRDGRGQMIGAEVVEEPVEAGKSDGA
jgi:hypothetical protein